MDGNDMKCSVRTPGGTSRRSAARTAAIPRCALVRCHGHRHTVCPHSPALLHAPSPPDTPQPLGRHLCLPARGHWRVLAGGFLGGHPPPTPTVRVRAAQHHRRWHRRWHRWLWRRWLWRRRIDVEPAASCGCGGGLGRSGSSCGGPPVSIAAIDGAPGSPRQSRQSRQRGGCTHAESRLAAPPQRQQWR